MVSHRCFLPEPLDPCGVFSPEPRHRSFEQCPGKKLKLLPPCPEVQGLVSEPGISIAMFDCQRYLCMCIYIIYTIIYIQTYIHTLHCITYVTLHYITLRYITLHYVTLHYITLTYITLHHITLHHITSHYITLHHITSHYITLHCITSNYIALHCITLHYITLRYVTLHCITLRYMT